MIGAIKQIDGWQAMSAAQLHDALSVKIAVPSNRGRLTQQKVAESKGLAVADAVYAAIAAQSPPTASRYTMGDGVNTGIDTSAQLWKEQADLAADHPQLGPILSPHKTYLKDYELDYVTRWSVLGGVGDVPEAAAIQVAITADQAETAETTRQNSIKAIMATLNYHVINPAIADGQSTPQQVVAALIGALNQWQ